MVFCFVEIHKCFQKFIWQCKGPRKTETILNENSVESFTAPDLMAFYKATIIKTLWFWSKDRHSQWNRVRESQNRLPYVYGQLIVGKGI